MKYRVPVIIITTADKHIGVVECDNMSDYKEKAEALWKAQDYDYPRTNISNDFEINDWDLYELSEADLAFYKEEEK